MLSSLIESSEIQQGLFQTEERVGSTKSIGPLVFVIITAYMRSTESVEEVVVKENQV